MWYCNIDSKQYGPVEIEVLQKWAKESRLSPQELVWREGMENWVAANTIGELKDCFAPPIHAISAAGRTVHGQAITSMVLGILSIMFGCGGLILGILAVMFRKRALKAMHDEPEKYTGEGFCTAGYITGIVGIVLGSFAILYFLFWIIFVLCVVGAGVATHGMH